MNPRADWRDTIQVGDILITPSGDWRVVRDVKYWPTEGQYKSRHGLLGFLDLAIRRCSWTGRPHRTLSRACIAGWSKLQGARAKLGTEADEKLRIDILTKRRVEELHYDCCDAKAFL